MDLIWILILLLLSLFIFSLLLRIFSPDVLLLLHCSMFSIWCGYFDVFYLFLKQFFFTNCTKKVLLVQRKKETIILCLVINKFIIFHTVNGSLYMLKYRAKMQTETRHILCLTWINYYLEISVIKANLYTKYWIYCFSMGLRFFFDLGFLLSCANNCTTCIEKAKWKKAN